MCICCQGNCKNSEYKNLIDNNNCERDNISENDSHSLKIEGITGTLYMLPKGGEKYA